MSESNGWIRLQFVAMDGSRDSAVGPTGLPIETQANEGARKTLVSKNAVIDPIIAVKVAQGCLLDEVRELASGRLKAFGAIGVKSQSGGLRGVLGADGSAIMGRARWTRRQAIARAERE